MAIRMIIELSGVEDSDDLRDAVIDAFIEGADTPAVEILDVIEETDPGWARGARF